MTEHASLLSSLPWTDLPDPGCGRRLSLIVGTLHGRESAVQSAFLLTSQAPRMRRAVV